MKRYLVAAVIALIGSQTCTAHAKPKASKGRTAPVVCLSYERVGAPADGLGICKDKKPVLLHDVSEVDIIDEDESERTIRVMVGWR